MNFFLETTNLALLAIAAISGLLLLQPLLLKSVGALASPMAATQLINQKAQVIDVRSADEFAAGHIRQSKNAPAAQFDEVLPSLKLKTDKPVLLVCATGKDTRKAAASLKAAGFAHIHVLEGGLKAWQEAQMPLVV